MAIPGRAQQRVRFGDFDLDLSTGELRNGKGRLVLQEKPFQILATLLGRPGQLVTRDELRNKLWPSDVFVDFDQSLNKAMNRLREALDDSAESPRFIETLARRGYRFIASVRRTSHSVVASSPPLHPAPSAAADLPTPAARLNSVIPPKLDEESSQDRDPHDQHPPGMRAGLKRFKPETETGNTTITLVKTTPRLQRKTAVISIGAFVVVLTALAATWGYYVLRDAQKIESLAVLPFANLTGDSNTEYLSDGITESLIASLSQVPDLAVRSRNSAFRYKGKDVDVRKVGSDLAVNALLTGRVTLHGDTIQVSAELTDVRNNTELWGAQYTRKNTEVLLLQQQIAGDIAGRLRSKLSSSEKQQVAKRGTLNSEAYELYLQGRYYFNKRTESDINTAISYLNQAIAKDPGYALAYSGLADAFSALPSHGGDPRETYAKSNAAARRAMELDPSLAHPHAVLGNNEMEYDWDFAGGEAEYRKAFELDPNDATAHHWYADDIVKIGGREQEAIAEISLAHRLDPGSPAITADMGAIHVVARQYDQGVKICKKLANENPTFAPTHMCLAWAYRGKNMYPQVIEEFGVYGQLSGDKNATDFASAMGRAFRAEGWNGALKKAVEVRKAQHKTGYASAYDIAALYADLGNKGEAFRWLHIAYHERDPGLLGLKTGLSFASLHSDPRFTELVHKVGLPD